MRDYSKMTDEELAEICFVNVDENYITQVIRNAKKQYREGHFIPIIKDGIDVKTGKHVRFLEWPSRNGVSFNYELINNS